MVVGASLLYIAKYAVAPVVVVTGEGQSVTVGAMHRHG